MTIEFRFEGDADWTSVPWSDFAADNPDDADDIAEKLAATGHCTIGGGAAPIVYIRRVATAA